MNDSRLSGLYKMSVADRIAALHARGWLTADEAARLLGGRSVLSSARADKLIENVIGVFGLPFAIAPNFIVNNRDCMVPLVLEEPSVVAALSGAARLARNCGGFAARCDESLLVGQVHVSGVEDPAAGLQALESRRQQLLDAANDVHPRLAARGGGVREVDFARLELPDGSPLIRVHLLVDTVDAMGANLVNTICEAIAPQIAALCRGNIALRILSNLADRSVVTASVRFAREDLAEGEFSGDAIRDAIVLASDIASVDPYRATTHNKGIMNGIDAVAIATGNDWRAIEAGAHAYAAASGRYRPLTRWRVDAEGDLAGEISIPLKAGTVGGTLASNPAAALGLSVTGARSADELALLMAAVGLAQNFAALRALAGSGIQQGHMKLHARSVAAAVGTPDEVFDEVVSRLVQDGEIKRWRAEQILDDVVATRAAAREPDASAAGKVILFGEHAVVYGRHALALPLADAVRAYAEPAGAATTLSIPAWGIDGAVDLDSPHGVGAAVALILRRLELADSKFSLVIESALPRAMGLGSSAAIAVALTRAISSVAGLGLDDDRVNAIAFDCEKLAHGTPSGVDNTIST
ncbi:MAG: hydroxymethylglutaryl-CoA reductase, degradative, partial [Gammaproteobacteria bacterium]|nr:hydroxymethylglutaryl-CoA reductase, degradative [Gammaproteobacteria bacterium]